MRTLPAVLKYLPSEKAQDARNFVQSLQYWLGGNAENLENLLLNTALAYVPALKGADIDVLEPQLFPDVGIWHPMAPSAFLDFALLIAKTCLVEPVARPSKAVGILCSTLRTHRPQAIELLSWIYCGARFVLS